jgi:LysR family transcriptional regulator, transcriptional activator for aaeXAB operon
MMLGLEYPLSLLEKAVAFKNLSAASQHIGLSQPQLSRVISKLETELGVELLDRKVKRKSSWTPQALQLAELVHENSRRFDLSIRTLQAKHHARQVNIATLEGLSEQAIRAGKVLFDDGNVEMIRLDVFDRSELEAKFLSGDVDLIFNTRVPGQSKPRYVNVLGYQMLENIEGNTPYELLSAWEFSNRRRHMRNFKSKCTLVSNSLHLRKEWLTRFGGRGTMPSGLMTKPKRGCDEVLMMAGDWFEARLWKLLVRGAVG